MNDINKVMKGFSNEFNMDYCENFDKVKSVFDYCNEHVKNFSKLQFRGGNKEVIKNIVERLQEHLNGLNYADNEHDLRKITFFLILNTDAVYRYDLNTDQHISHVLNILPQLPKFLLISLVWDLKLDQSFYEMLSYTPSWFSIQFIEPAIASMKYLKPYDVLEKVENLVKSICMSICRSNFDTLDLVSTKIILNKLYDHTMDLLRQFYTPDIEKFSSWSGPEFFKYSGFAIKHLLNSIIFAFDKFEYPITRKLEDKYRIYEICRNVSPVKTETPNKYSDLIEDSLLKIIFALLNSLEYNVMLVTVEVFISWVEVDITDELTLQADVGDRAYQVLERIHRNNKFGHGIEQLKFIAIRRKTLEQTVTEANIGEILRKIEDLYISDKERRMWFNELFERPIIFGNEECLETIKIHSNLITLDCCMKLMDQAKGDVDDMETDTIVEHIIPTIIKSLSNYNCDQLVELIAYELQTFGPHINFEQKNFRERCTEFFNKCNDDFDTKSFLLLCFESPEFVWKKFMVEACESQQQVKNFSNALVKTKKFSKTYIKSLLNITFTTTFDAKFYPNLIFEVYHSQILEPEKFFKSFIYKNVVCSMEADQLPPLFAMLKALLLITQKSRSAAIFGSVTPPVLVMVGQIMEKSRWDLVSYSDLNDEIVRLSADVIQLASKTFLPVASDSDKKWIREKVKDFRSLTKYYFQKFSLKVNEHPKHFDKYLHPKEFSNISDIERFLIVNYVRCTTKETEWLAKSDRLQPHITDAIVAIEQIVSDLGENAIKNFRHCIVNYENIIKKFLIPSMSSTKEELRQLGFKILKIISDAPKSLYDEIFMNLQATLLDVFQAAAPIDEELLCTVRKYLSTMPNCKGKEIFGEKYQAMATENSN